MVPLKVCSGHVLWMTVLRDSLVTTVATSAGLEADGLLLIFTLAALLPEQMPGMLQNAFQVRGTTACELRFACTGPN